MPVTLKTFEHPPRKWRDGHGHPATSADELFQRSCHQEHRKSKRIIRSSIPENFFTAEGIESAPKVVSSSNGWVRAAFYAYNEHHHLQMRPEDIWFAILSQISFYINAHAEELRSYFVAHEGQKGLEVKAVGTIDTVDFGYMSQQMTHLISENVKDPTLRDWIMPSWTTTEETDRTVAAILMMGSLQKYFSYTMTCMCGMPSVTLLGEKSDWEDILKRLDKLDELGDEPSQFATLLRPILRHFVASFNPEAAKSKELRDFWGKIVHYERGGSGPSYLSGWITAFCFWDEDGKSLYHLPSSDRCEIDGAVYHRIDSSKIPEGFASVPVKVDDNGEIHHTRMVAGSLGIQLWSSGESTGNRGDRYDMNYDSMTGKWNRVQVAEEGSEDPGLDSVRPLAGWFMYELKEEGEEKKEEQQPFPGFPRRTRTTKSDFIRIGSSTQAS